VVSWATTRSATIEHVVNGEPALLFHRGRFLRDSMREQRVTEHEMLAAARLEGMASLEEVEAIVLETDGEFSIVHATDKRHGSTLRDVPGAGRREPRPPRYAARAD
jgi:uncharacterized membrane protein YcaP (DUF421 family)